MLPLEERVAYWKMLVQQKPTGHPQVDSASLEEMRVALRDAITEIRMFTDQQRHPSIAVTARNREGARL